MTASLLPNGQLQFLDNNGEPLASGYVYTYTPGTTGFKNSWQNSGQTTLNTNPIRLDAGGRCTLYGSGQYRLVVQDSGGNLVEDTLTSDTLAATGQLPYGVDVGGVNAISIPSLSPEISALNTGQSFLAKINHTVTGPTTLTLEAFGTFSCLTPDGLAFSAGDLQATVDAFFIYTGSAMQLMSPNLGLLVFNNGVASAGSAAGVIGTTNPNVPSTRVTEQTSLFSILVAQGTTSHNTGTIEVGGNFGLVSNTGTAGHETVCLYGGLEAKPGTRDAYAIEASLAIDAGATAANIPNLFGLQVLFTNSDRDLPITGVNGFGTGIRLSGTPSAGCTGSFGFLMLGGALGSELFHVGLAFEPHTAKEYAILENSGALVGAAFFGGTGCAYKIDCAPQNGIIGTSAWDMRCASTKGLVSSNHAGNADYTLIGMNVADVVYIGDSRAPFIISLTNFAPGADNQYSLGSGTGPARWTAVWAVNGTIQTSDRREKDLIQTSDLGLEFVNALHPVSFVWKSDLLGPKNYGIIAQDLEKTLAGRSFGGLYKPSTPDDLYGLNYDSLISPMVKAIQELSAKVALLESKLGGLA